MLHIAVWAPIVFILEGRLVPDFDGPRALGRGLGLVVLAIAALPWLRSVFHGLVFALELRYHLGDDLQVGGVKGRVVAVGVRALTLRAPDGTDAVVPYERLTSETVIRLNLVARDTPCELEVEIPPTLAPARAVELARQAAALSRFASPRVSPEVFLAPKQGRVTELMLRIRGFLFDREHEERYRSDVVERLHAAFVSRRRSGPPPPRRTSDRVPRGPCASRPCPTFTSARAATPTSFATPRPTSSPISASSRPTTTASSWSATSIRPSTPCCPELPPPRGSWPARAPACRDSTRACGVRKYLHLHGNHDAVAARELGLARSSCAWPPTASSSCSSTAISSTRSSGGPGPPRRPPPGSPVACGARACAHSPQWFEGRDVALKHRRFGHADGPYARAARRLLREHDADLVVMGHTHVPHLHVLPEGRVVNTGSCSRGRRMHVTIDTRARSVEIHVRGSC